MLLDLKRLEIMRENAKQLAAEAKTPTPDGTFLRQVHAEARQVKNLQIHATVRTHTLNIDEPIDGGGDDSAPSPVETLVAALAACTEVNWVAYSTAFNVDIQEAVVQVEGTIDRRYVQGVTYGVPARLQTVKIVSRVVTNAPKEKIEKVYQRVQQMCPVAGSLHPDIQKEYLLEILSPPK